MRTIKLVIGFVGTRYEGWQSQRKGKTIQEVFEKILEKILTQKTHLAGASRTDSGVHALGFAAHFKARSFLPDKKIKDALNFYLPRDIVVYSAKTVPGEFHARFNAKSKIYRYDIWNSPTRPLLEDPYVLWYPRLLDIFLMKKAAVHFIGKRDFAAFEARTEERRSTVRHLKRLSVKKKKSLIRIEAEGDGFLRHMIRIVVGTLIEVGRKKMAPQDIPNILKSKNRRRAGPTAKAHGLTLVKVKY